MEGPVKNLKIYLILLAVLLALMLSGCVQIDIETGIDQNFSAHLSYHITLSGVNYDLAYRDQLISALHQIALHYREYLGFVVDVQTEDEPYSIFMTRRVENDSFEQALQALEDMLTDESLTIFMQVEIASQSLFRHYRYTLGATVDIPQIMRLSNAEELPPAMQLQLEEALEAGRGEITVTMPASELISSTHPAKIENHQATMVVPLEFTSRVSFELEGNLNLLSSGAPGGTLDEIIRMQTLMRTAAIAACFFAAILILIVLLAIAISRRQRKTLLID